MQQSHVERPTPKSDAACGRVSPLVVAMRTASRRNSSVYLVAILYLLHSKHCSKETGNKPEQDHPARWHNLPTNFTGMALGSKL
jgi:hypothetical protein